MKNRAGISEFTSALSRREMIAVLCWIPVHLALLPLLFNFLWNRGLLSEAAVNFLYYAVGFAYMLTVAFAFLRREFDPLADRPLFVIGTACGSYLMMMVLNGLVGFLILRFLPGSENPNNASVTDLVIRDFGVMKATLVFLGPLVEEMMFRAGIFGLFRRRSRALAYAVSMGFFALYHVWAYALQDPIYWLYLLQYLPAGWLLARCYERTNTIWGSIFFHMIVNGVAVSTISALQELM